MGNNSWVLRDFNSIHSFNKRIGEVIDHDDDVGISDFNDCNFSLDLNETFSGGFFFTWCNKREGTNRIFSKIFRTFVNNAHWLSSFPHFDLTIQSPSCLDHSP